MNIWQRRHKQPEHNLPVPLPSSSWFNRKLQVEMHWNSKAGHLKRKQYCVQLMHTHDHMSSLGQERAGVWARRGDTGPGTALGSSVSPPQGCSSGSASPWALGEVSVSSSSQWTPLVTLNMAVPFKNTCAPNKCSMPSSSITLHKDTKRRYTIMFAKVHCWNQTCFRLLTNNTPCRVWKVPPRWEY